MDGGPSPYQIVAARVKYNFEISQDQPPEAGRAPRNGEKELKSPLIFSNFNRSQNMI
jgi:hypothetical protein